MPWSTSRRKPLPLLFCLPFCLACALLAGCMVVGGPYFYDDPYPYYGSPYYGYPYYREPVYPYPFWGEIRGPAIIIDDHDHHGGYRPYDRGYDHRGRYR